MEAVKSKRRKLVDVAIAVVLVIICLVLAKSLLNQLSLKREVKAATAVTNQVITDIRKQDGTAARKLGNKTFQAQNSATNLTTQFKTVSKYTGSDPIIERQTVTNDKSGQAVSIIYKFPKPAFYIRVIVTKPNGSDTFQLANLKANTSNTPLLDNKY